MPSPARTTHASPAPTTDPSPVPATGPSPVPTTDPSPVPTTDPNPARPTTDGTGSASPKPAESGGDGRERRRGRGPGAAVAAALIGFVVITLDVSAVNVALPAMGDSLDGGMSGLQWVVDSYTLFFAALMLSAGALSDRIGARRAYGWGLAVFILASLACGLAPTLGVLIGARVVQGAAAAVMMPTSLALIRQAYDDAARRARAVAVWAAGGAVAMAAGPVLGGLLTSVWDWRYVFLINVPVGAVGVVLLARVARSPRRQAAFDLPGQCAAVLALAGLTYAVIEGGHAGYGHPLVLTATGVALAAGAVFVAVEARHRDPMVPLTMLRRRTVAVPVLVGFTVNASFYGAIFVFGLYFQQARGQSALSAGLMFVPMALATAALNLLSPRLTARVGPRTSIVAGQFVLAAGLLGITATDAGTPTVAMIALMLPVGFAGATVVPALTTLMLESVEPARAGTAAAVLNTSRQMGGALGVALFGAFLAVPADDFVAGVHLSMEVGAVLILATALATWALLEGRAGAER
ncbi:MFS transporter [Streptomyces sp. NBC_01186]|nr:MFS transporter [Streptomyces sp. NBC_01186]